MLAASGSEPTSQRAPGAVARVAAGARRAGVLVRALEGCVAVSPPLTATPEHFSLMAEAIAHGLDEVARAGATGSAAP